MTDPIRRNRLAEEQSPYLRQHADNPVHWQPWDETALEAARERDVPIFLSIGYSACHWCHVMADESFDDEDVAAILNEQFVPIKVDREERPDVDRIYMTVCSLVTGSGGWPLSAWLTPAGKPFYVGTYFPKNSKRGMPGFVDLLDQIADSWETDRDAIEQRAEEWTKAARNYLEEPAGAQATTAAGTGPGAETGTRADEVPKSPSSELLVNAAKAIVRSADRAHGGFGSDGPKFPQPTRLSLLARAYDRTGTDEYRDVLVETLDAMADGGLYDHVGGGFHRYCVDRDWTVPHFEKMLYDNAELPRAYLEGYQLTGTDRYETVVHETLSFVDRELTHDGGGFFSTLDAQSETTDGDRAEGAYYVWTPEQVSAVLDDDTAALVCARYGIDDSGNFEGTTVLNRKRSVAQLADRFDLAESTVEGRLDGAREQLFEARTGRRRPNRDEKVLAGWNGLMISAFAEAALVFDRDEYAESAVDALSFVRHHHWEGEVSHATADESSVDNRLARRYKDGDVAIDGYLDDYAFLARAGLHCYEATGDVDHLSFAIDLARVIVTEFWDPERKTLYFTPESGESLLTRPQELSDQSTPAATGVAVETLLALDPFAEQDFESIATTVLETHTTMLEANPLEHATLCRCADRLTAGPLEITIAADSAPDHWRKTIGAQYLPDRLIAHRPPTEAKLAPWVDQLSSGDRDSEFSPPIWAGRDARDGEPTLYVCRHRTCSPPVHDVEEALDWLDEMGS